MDWLQPERFLTCLQKIPFTRKFCRHKANPEQGRSGWEGADFT